MYKRNEIAVLLLAQGAMSTLFPFSELERWLNLSVSKVYHTLHLKSAETSIKDLFPILSPIRKPLLRRGLILNPAMKNGVSETEAFAAAAAFSRDNARTPMQWSSEAEAGFTSGRPTKRSCWRAISKAPRQRLYCRRQSKRSF